MALARQRQSNPENASVSPDTRTDELADSEISAIRNIIDKDHRVEGDLRRDVSMSIKRLMDIGAYRGLRHRKDYLLGDRELIQWPYKKRSAAGYCRQEKSNLIILSWRQMVRQSEKLARKKREKYYRRGCTYFNPLLIIQLLQ